MTTKNIIISIIMIALVIGSAGYYYYTSALSKSKQEGANIISRGISKPTTINPINSPSSQNKILKSGSFNTLDPAHYAKGSVQAIQNLDNVRIDFSSDFETNPDGPDLYVWLVKKQEIKNIALGGVSSKAGDYIDLGAIASKAGGQSYQVTTSEFQNNDYAVVIWCRAFGIQFSNAILQ